METGRKMAAASTSKTEGGAVRVRPTSPHATIYRPQLTAVLSILHRLSGVVASLGAVLLVVWLMALAGNAEHYARVREWMAAPVGLALLMAVSLAVIYHLLNGLRHLLWDAGYGFDLPTTYRTGWFVVITTLVSSVLLWVYLLSGGPGA